MHGWRIRASGSALLSTRTSAIYHQGVYTRPHNGGWRAWAYWRWKAPPTKKLAAVWTISSLSDCHILGWFEAHEDTASQWTEDTWCHFSLTKNTPVEPHLWSELKQLFWTNSGYGRIPCGCWTCFHIHWFLWCPHTFVGKKLCQLSFNWALVWMLFSLEGYFFFI